MVASFVKCLCGVGQGPYRVKCFPVCPSLDVQVC